MRIPTFYGVGAGSLLIRACKQFIAHDTASYAAAVTYHLLFSIFPFVIFFIALLGFLELSALFDWVRNRSEAFFLQQTIPQINLVLDQLQQRRVGILSFSVLFALWASSSCMRAMMTALNVVYEVSERRSMLKRYTLSVVYTFGIGSMVALVISTVLVTPQAMQALTQYFGIQHDFAILWAWWLRWPVVMLLLTVVVALVYAVGPDAEQRFRFVTPGACIAVIALTCATAGLDFYVRNIQDLDALYGSVGTVIVLLWYCFMSSVIVLFGAELNASIECHAPTGKNAGERHMRSAGKSRATIQGRNGEMQ